jgi:plastocyanin
MLCRKDQPRMGGSAVAVLALLAAGAPLAIAEPPALQFQIQGLQFVPTELTVPVGSTVTWINRDPDTHAVASLTRLFRSTALDTGASFSFKFEKPGTYQFACSFHPQMRGTVIVK